MSLDKSVPSSLDDSAPVNADAATIGNITDKSSGNTYDVDTLSSGSATVEDTAKAPETIDNATTIGVNEQMNITTTNGDTITMDSQVTTNGRLVMDGGVK